MIRMWSQHCKFNTQKFISLERYSLQDFPGGPVAKTSCFQCRDAASIPGWGTKDTHIPCSMTKNKILERELKK